MSDTTALSASPPDHDTVPILVLAVAPLSAFEDDTKKARASFFEARARLFESHACESRSLALLKCNGVVADGHPCVYARPLILPSRQELNGRSSLGQLEEPSSVAAVGEWPLLEAVLSRCNLAVSVPAIDSPLKVLTKWNQKNLDGFIIGHRRCHAGIRSSASVSKRCRSDSTYLRSDSPLCSSASSTSASPTMELEDIHSVTSSIEETEIRNPTNVNKRSRLVDASSSPSSISPPESDHDHDAVFEVALERKHQPMATQSAVNDSESKFACAMSLCQTGTESLSDLEKAVKLLEQVGRQGGSSAPEAWRVLASIHWSARRRFWAYHQTPFLNQLTAGKAAELWERVGDAQSLYYAAVRVYHQRGVFMDKNRALHVYEKAGELGHVQAKFLAAFMHDRGDGVPQNTSRARQLYGDIRALGSNALMSVETAFACGAESRPPGYVSYEFEFKDDAFAAVLLEVAGNEFSDPEAYYRAAQVLLRPLTSMTNGASSKLYILKALSLLEKAAQLRCIQSMQLLAKIYSEGWYGMPRNASKAVAYHEAVAQRFSKEVGQSDSPERAQALLKAARIYDVGAEGVKVDKAKALSLYTQAVKVERAFEARYRALVNPDVPAHHMNRVASQI